MGADVLSAACKRAMIGLYADTSGYDGMPEPEFSNEFLQYIKKLASHVRGGKYRRLTKTAKIILIAAILALLAALSVFAAKELRILLIDHGVGSYLDVEKRSETLSEGITLGYIPEGFSLSEEYSSAHVKTKSYYNSDGLFFNIMKRASYGGGDINTEGIIPQRKDINGIEYIISSDDNGTVIIWISATTDCLYDVNGNLDENELLQIAIHCE
ncbi:MAG: DUF4367 domain-containing protein [Clostridia bacterium]|nr:DUF4367 domain-containing protein [Clostridia bacterium]